ncbi:amidohydrolase family protein [Dehalococcoides sp. THU3]|uniref:amidohydrolase family protein n=1 Tax=Dehalococcoides TaxID=61434 RepID=UPI0005B570D7|nr:MULTISPECIES: amidohydrolase family protein [Dehalococcoides]QYY57622.1 amidohydrolase family protein [Dehalococcoides mccartyi]BAQ35166.1 putative hydrolase [Dehalococcoides sp. UCH007]
MVIDFHTHIFPPKIIAARQDYACRDSCLGMLYSNPKAKMITAEELLTAMDEAGIDRAVALNIGWESAELCTLTNNYLLESARRYPGRIIPFCTLPISDPSASLTELERCRSLGAKGIGELRTEHPKELARPPYQPLFDRIDQSGLICLFHASEPLGHTYPGKGLATPEKFYPFISHYPKLKIILAHLGGGMPFYYLMPEAEKVLANTAYDTAAAPFLYKPEIYRQVIKLAGESRVLFGSDYPLMPYTRALKHLSDGKLEPDILAKVMQQNALNWLGEGQNGIG